MKEVLLVKHARGAPGLRLLGLGPKFAPCRSLEKLKILLNENTLWAKNRRTKEIKECIAKSDVIVSLWIDFKILGFGRALSDGVYRGVLWDIVIDKNYQGKGYGRLVVNALLESDYIKNTEKIYLMTTNKKEFYSQMNFKKVLTQDLLLREKIS